MVIRNKTQKLTQDVSIWKQIIVILLPIDGYLYVCFNVTSLYSMDATTTI